MLKKRRVVASSILAASGEASSSQPWTKLDSFDELSVATSFVVNNNGPGKMNDSGSGHEAENKTGSVLMLTHQHNQPVLVFWRVPLDENKSAICATARLKPASYASFQFTRHFSASSLLETGRCEYLVASPFGSINVVEVSDGGKAMTKSFDVSLCDDGEVVTNVLSVGGGLYVLVTSFGSTIVVRQSNDDDFRPYQLSREKASFFGFFKNLNSFVLGKESSGGMGQFENKAISQVLLLCNSECANDIDQFESSVLICVGSTLSCWKSWNQPNAEECDDFDLKAFLLQDLQSINVNLYHYLELFECCFLFESDANHQIHIQTISANIKTVSLALLVAVRSSSHPADSENNCHGSRSYLWCYVVEMPAPFSSSKVSIKIVHRVLLSVSLASPKSFLPRLSSHSNSTLLISWSEEYDNGCERDGDNACNETATMRFLQIDASKQSPSSLTKSCRLEELQPRFTSKDSALSVDLVKSIDGFEDESKNIFVVVVMKNGNIVKYLAQPSLESPLPTFELNEIVNHRQDIDEVLCEAAFDPERALHEVRALLTEYIERDSKPSNTCVQRLKALGTVVDADKLASLVQDISRGIVEKSKTGQHWQILSTQVAQNSQDVDMRGSIYQLVHKVMEQKEKYHTKLMTILILSNIIDPFNLDESDQATSSSSWKLGLLRTHQTLLAAYGLSSATHLNFNLWYQKSEDIVATTTFNGRNVGSAKKASSGNSLIFEKTNDVHESPIAPSSLLNQHHDGQFAEFLKECHCAGLKIVHQGIEHVVSNIWKLNKNDYESQGYSANDVFFNKIVDFLLTHMKSQRSNDGYINDCFQIHDSTVYLFLLSQKEFNLNEFIFSNIADGFSGIAHVLNECLNNVDDNGWFDEDVMKKVFGVMLFFLSMIQLPAKSDAGSGNRLSSFTCDISGSDRVRKALLQTLRQFLLASRGGSRQWFAENSALGCKVQTLCVFLLRSYEVEEFNLHVNIYTRVSESQDKSLLLWRQNYAQAKELCISILLGLGHLKSSFQISNNFLCFDGLTKTFQAAQELEDVQITSMDISIQNVGKGRMLSNQFWFEIMKLIQSKPRVFGTEEKCFALFMMEWLEKGNKLQLLFSLGQAALPVFLSFLETRPHLSWLYFLQNKKYDNTCDSLIEVTKHVGNVEDAKTLLSIGKLALLLKSESENVTGSSPNSYMDYCQPLNSVSSNCLQSLVIQRGLFLIEAQNRLLALQPDLSNQEMWKDNARLSVNALIDQYLKFVWCQLIEISSLHSSLSLQVNAYFTGDGVFTDLAFREQRSGPTFSSSSDVFAFLMTQHDERLAECLFSIMALLTIALDDLTLLEPAAKLEAQNSLKLLIFQTYSLSLQVNIDVWVHLFENGAKNILLPGEIEDVVESSCFAVLLRSVQAEVKKSSLSKALLPSSNFFGDSGVDELMCEFEHVLVNRNSTKECLSKASVHIMKKHIGSLLLLA